MDALAECRPRFDVRQVQLAVGPAVDHYFVNFLEGPQLLGVVRGALHVPVQLANVLVLFDQSWQGLLEHRLGLILVQSREHDRLRPGQPVGLKHFTHNPRRIDVSPAGTGVDMVETNVAARPIFAEQSRLRLTHQRELIVVLGKE